MFAHQKYLLSLMALFGCVGALLSIPALAQSKNVEIADADVWTHEPTGIVLAPAIVGFYRTEVASTAPADLDMQVQYRNRTGSAFATFYIFHPAAGDLPLWFDRAHTVIATSDRFKPDENSGVPVLFETGGPINLPAMRAVFRPTTPGFTSTGVALIGVGDWIAKVRMSSTAMNNEELDGALTEFIDSIKFAEDDDPIDPQAFLQKTAVSPALIADCLSRLSLNGKAKKVKTTGSDAISGAFIGSLSGDAQTIQAKEDAAPIVYCRDSQLGTHAVYRPDGADDRYLIALTDAGRVVSVGSTFNLQSEPRFSLSFIDLHINYQFENYDRLIPPDQALQILETAKPISSASTVDGKRSISINTDLIKD